MLENAEEDEAILVDFDHTLLLNNSTELFLHFSRPRWLVFFLTRISDYICKKMGLRPERWRDYARVHIVTILTPWNVLLWRLCSGRLWKRYGNKVLAGLLANTPSRLIVISNGFHFVINPILKKLSCSSELIAGRFLEDRNSVCVKGKLASMKRRQDDVNLESSVFITDSMSDKDMLDACGKSFLIQWGDDKFKAFRNYYFPFRYYAEAKYPRRNFILRQLFGEDYLILLLGYGVVFNGLLPITLLFLSFMSLYEVGYYWNDFKTAKKEKTPRINREARPFFKFPMVPWAYLFSMATGLLGLYSGGFLNVPNTLMWFGILAGMQLAFVEFNGLSEINRKFFFPVLHAFKLFAFAPFFTFSVIGVPLLLSQWATQISIYNIYRHFGKTELFGRQRYRLAVFPVILVMSLTFTQVPEDFISFGFYLLLAFLWLAYRAVTEKFGPLTNLMPWKK